MIEVVKKTVSRTGMASFGFVLGRGYVKGKTTVKTDGVWCVVENGRTLAECKGEKSALRICGALRAAKISGG